MESTNGVDATALAHTRRAVRAVPTQAELMWRATAEWVDGAHTRTTVDSYRGVGGDRSPERVFSYDTDHPPVLGGRDAAASPVEVVLAGLAGCLTGGIATIAEARGIRLQSVVATIEGDMDVRGVLGLDSGVRAGANQVRVSYRIEADATPSQIRALVAQSRRRSAVYDLVANETPILIEVVS